VFPVVRLVTGTGKRKNDSGNSGCVDFSAEQVEEQLDRNIGKYNMVTTSD